jgi:hypothetical protein
MCAALGSTVGTVSLQALGIISLVALIFFGTRVTLTFDSFSKTVISSLLSSFYGQFCLDHSFLLYCPVFVVRSV